MKKYLIKLPDSFTLKGRENPLGEFIEHFTKAANCPAANIKSNILYEVKTEGKTKYDLCGDLSDECYNDLIKGNLMSEESLISRENYEKMLAELKKNNDGKNSVIAMKFSDKGLSLTKILEKDSKSAEVGKEECIIL